MPTTTEGSRKISATGKEAKELLTKLVGLKVGSKLEFDGFLTGFGGKTTGHLVEVEPGKFWQFSMFWNGVHIQEVVAELQNEGKDLILESLGS